VFPARYLALHVILTLVAIAPAYAQGVAPAGALSEISIPGGLKAALAVIDDRAAADRSQFLLEFIRRTYDTPLILKDDQRVATLRALLAQLDRAAEQSASAPSPDGPARAIAPARDRASADASTPGDDVLPLPLTPSIWIDVVFAGRATPRTLVRSIVASREASLFYCALMSLDDDTRAWLATEPALIKEVVAHRAGALVAAAPGLRVRAGAVRVPGGPPLELAWEAVVGRRVHDPAGFTRALLAENEGTLAWYFGSMAQLSPGEIGLAFNVESSDPAVRSAAARRLYGVFRTLAWKLEARTFWRPSLDPALLVSALPRGDNGHPSLPGTLPFWTAVFAREPPRDDVDTRALARGEAIDFSSLSEQIFDADALARRSRYNLVLFAARKAPRVTPENARDAVTAVRAAGSYPALVASLERAGLGDLAAYAAAARRAAELSRVGDKIKAVRAFAQFQGTVAFVTRTALTGTLAPGAVAAAVTSLSAVDLGKGGDYEGRLVQWLTAFVGEHASTNSGSPTAPDPSLSVSDTEAIARVPGDLDRDALRIVAGPVSSDRRYVDWEGTRYRFDVATAEAIRLARLLGENHRPYITSANALVEIADALAGKDLTRDTLRRQLDALVGVGTATGWEGTDAVSSARTDAPPAYRQAVAKLRRAAANGKGHNASKVGDPLRELADDLLGRGLMDLAYAVAMGSPERKPISVAEAASRHDFKGDVVGNRFEGAWRLPAVGSRSVPRRTWHIAGSLLGLDVTLAELSLLRLSTKPPARRPTLSDEDRRVMTESVALTQPAALSDAGVGIVLETLGKGRARIGAVRTDADARALAAEIGLGPARTTLLPWLVTHDPGRITAFLSPVEIFWVGLESRPVDGVLQAWGSAAGPRLGCLCVQLLDRRPWETFAGRWNLGVLASSFPDLNLRLVEVLSDLHMPAPVLRAVLAAATVDFTDNATSRDPDDRRGPVEFVQALGPDRVEQYLALLTTDGPLFPVGDSSGAAAGAGSGTSGASR
jgi:hypothetical protein